MQPDQRATQRYPCPVCGGTEQCLRYTSNGKFCMCQNPPEQWRHYPSRHIATFGKDFWTIPLSVVGKAHAPVGEEEPGDRWAGYPRAYSSLLRHLVLSKVWRSHLLDRGFTGDQIAEREYRSFPRLERMLEIATELHRIYDTVWSRIPGFGYTRRGSPCFHALERRLLIPIRNPAGRIVGVQTRRQPDDTSSPKYMWLDHGGMLKTPFHHIGSSQTVLFTEGPLKADLVHYRTAWQVISWQGVGCLTGISRVAQSVQGKTVYIANDLDLFTNKAVMSATRDAVHFLSVHVPVGILLWDGPKGIDDYLAQGGTRFRVYGPEVLKRRDAPCQCSISI